MLPLSFFKFSNRGSHDWHLVCPDVYGDYIHLQHYEDDQLVDGGILYDRQLYPVVSDFFSSWVGNSGILE